MIPICQNELRWNIPSKLPIFFDESAIEERVEEEYGDDDCNTHNAEYRADDDPSR